MHPFRADLHCHSTCSDGTLTPTELIHLAVKLNLKALSITDHDTIGAYKEALEEAKKVQLPLISGVEFSTTYKKTNVHVLAYSFSLDSVEIQKLCKFHCHRRTLRNQMILDLLKMHQMPIDEIELKQSTPAAMIGRPHIALLMMKKGYVRSVKEAFHLYLGENKPCYHPGEKVSTEETIEIIHRAKGLAIVAHPHLIAETKVVKSLTEMEFDGLEGYYARFSSLQNERWIKIAKHKNWIITGGSDFHGDIKPSLPLGASWVDEDTFSFLLRHFQNH